VKVKTLNMASLDDHLKEELEELKPELLNDN